MRLHVLFAQRRENYSGEYGPEVMLAWDEWSVDENPTGFAMALERVELGLDDSEFVGSAVVQIEISDDDVSEIRTRCGLDEGPPLRGELVE